MSLYRAPRDSISPSAKPQRHTSRSAARLAAAWAQHPFIIIPSAGTKAGSRVLLSDHLFYLWWPCQDHQIILNHGYLYHVRNAWWVRSKHLHFEGDLSTPGVSVRVRITTYKHHTECMGTDDWPFVQSSHPCCRVMRMSGLIATTVSCLLCLLCFLPRST